eukprot:5755009-Lingulodinium_polyedra.AAC.1
MSRRRVPRHSAFHLPARPERCLSHSARHLPSHPDAVWRFGVCARNGPRYVCRSDMRVGTRACG